MKDEKLKRRLIELLRKTPIVQYACEREGVGRSTFYRWKQSDKQFAKAVDSALQEGAGLVNDIAESQLIGMIKDKNMSAIVMWLKHHHPTYANRLEVKGSLTHIEELSTEEKKLITRALELAMPENKKDEPKIDD